MSDPDPHAKDKTNPAATNCKIFCINQNLGLKDYTFFRIFIFEFTLKLKGFIHIRLNQYTRSHYLYVQSQRGLILCLQKTHLECEKSAVTTGHSEQLVKEERDLKKSEI
jgi:hypothetical protein